ncbi:MAG: hypothetical protein ABJD13_16070 [Paracoccaceae bacterium]
MKREFTHYLTLRLRRKSGWAGRTAASGMIGNGLYGLRRAFEGALENV